MKNGTWIILGVGAVVLVGLYYAKRYATRQTDDLRTWIKQGGGGTIPADAGQPVPPISDYQIQIMSDQSYDGLIRAGISAGQAEAQVKALNPTWLGPAKI